MGLGGLGLGGLGLGGLGWAGLGLAGLPPVIVLRQQQQECVVWIMHAVIV